jgi:hypothetical protein
MSPRVTGALRWIVLAAIVAQLAIPALALTGPRPTRFGWQMFTTMAPAPSVWTEEADGSLRPVDLDALLVHGRPETDLTPALVATLCEGTGVRAVVVEGLDGRSRNPC